MIVLGEEIRLTIRDDGNILTARLKAKNMAQKIGFNHIDQTRISTAVSEIARNVVQHADHGEMVIRHVEDPEGIEVTVVDKGPGIEDVERALRGGYSTKNCLGLGLSGAKRLMDEFSIETEVGKGTKIVMKKWIR